VNASTANPAVQGTLRDKASRSALTLNVRQDQMNPRPNITFRNPVAGGAHPEHIARPTIRRPSVWLLVLVYLLWISFLVAVIQMPRIPPLGAFAFVMSLFIWFPYWAYRNWNDLVSDLPATCTAIGMVIMITTIIQLDSLWSFSEARNNFRLFILENYYPKMENWRSPWQIKLIDSLAQNMVVAIILLRRTIFNWISTRITQKLSNRSHSTDAEQAAPSDGEKPPK